MNTFRIYNIYVHVVCSPITANFYKLLLVCILMGNTVYPNVMRHKCTCT